MPYIFLLTLIYLLTACGRQDNEPTFNYLPVELDAKEALINVPNDANQLHDRKYMNRINGLLEQHARQISPDLNFVELTKAAAWGESRWRHYVKDSDRFFVILGDNGQSLGIMQVSRTHHGTHLYLEENIRYGVKLLLTNFQTANEHDCANGSNKGKDLYKIVRRAYAQYNGGADAICRNKDARDDRIEGYFVEKPWHEYL